MKRKICVVSGSRADYDLLRRLLQKLDRSKKYKLIFFVTGAHLSSKYGKTINYIKEDGLKINSKIKILAKNDLPQDIAKNISNSVRLFSDNFIKFKNISLVILLGDRYEIFGSAIAAFVNKIPIAHIHGGEVTSGSLDDSFRHSISKFSSLHFPSSKEHRNRLIQLGENPNTIFNVGSLGIENINNSQLLTKKSLESALKIKLQKFNLLVSLHPETLTDVRISKQIEQLLLALKFFKNCLIVFTYPNLEINSTIFISKIKSFVKNNNNAFLFYSLGQLKFFSCLNLFDGLIGNSSSALLEAPSFDVGIVNIGNRQKGRKQSKNIINCPYDKEQIVNSINKILNPNFIRKDKRLKKITKYYQASANIIKIIDKKIITNLLNKDFYDI